MRYFLSVVQEKVKKKILRCSDDEIRLKFIFVEHYV